ncbi:AIPR family protein [Sphingomonas sp. RB56-2]|uniref:AIPR family protein n=1 Tax=Sphingomonas brevis TaxID=2908206 RepID=A0ABT0SBZ0_9SPHN|nr:AIPR family protein [Sphingomonas brevis]MCL6741576.1 AIPR family protein [Sphingomonas brevis]
MSDNDLDQAFESFLEELQFAQQAEGESPKAAFFRMYADLAAENGDSIDLIHTPAKKEGQGSYRIDGSAFDAERGVLYLAVCDFREGSALETLNASHIETLTQRVRRFVELALDEAFLERFSKSDPEFEAGYPLAFQAAAVRRIRVILFSNARLATRRPPEPAPEIGGRPVVYNFLDFARYADILRSRSSPEPIEVDLIALNGTPVPCLPAFNDADDYQSYLVALPGKLLADIYGLYGARLLEQNVRTFLQAKTKVNKGILATLKETPEMFFAYNNGLTATASGVRTASMPDGSMAIAAIDNLQIVNGGQTTASILYARDRSASELDRVYVQMKLSVVRPELVEDIVPKISRFANTQNKVNEADFFASHKFHVTMQQISRRLMAPPRPGMTGGSKWFYERARGQYRDGKAYGTLREKQRFEAEFPPAQLIDKTDLAKFETTYACLPHIVCLGGQKCFLHFAEKIEAEWLTSELSFNDDWYRAVAAKALLFRWTDRMIGQSDWYREDRGYKSQTVAYTLARLVSHVKKSGKAGLNLQIIWNSQDIPEEICEALRQLAPQISRAIKDTPETVRNVGEYCKKQACWNAIERMSLEVPEIPEALMLDVEEARVSAKEGRAVRQIDKGIELEAKVLELIPHAQALHTHATRLQLLTPQSRTALSKLAAGRFPLPHGDLRAIGDLFARMSAAGFDPSSLIANRESADSPTSSSIRLSSSAVRTVRI